MDTTRVLLIGLGSLGSQVLDLLLRIPVDLEVLVCSLSESKLEQRTNLSHLAALQLGCNPRASWAQLDVSDVDRTAELIARFRPDIIFSAVCLQSWWVIGTLPKEAFDRLDRSQVGPWLPMHLALVYKLMRAVRASGHRAIVVNASYPDVVNPMLNKVGLGPDIGVGNVSNAIPGLRMALSFTLGVPVEQIQVRFFAHHYVSHRLSGKGNSGGAPFHLTVYLEGKDITPHIDIGTVCKLLATRFKRLGGAD